jgi:hypothetical protein
MSGKTPMKKGSFNMKLIETESFDHVPDGYVSAEQIESEMGLPREVLELWSVDPSLLIPETREDRRIRRWVVLRGFASHLKLHTVVRKESGEVFLSEKFADALRTGTELIESAAENLSDGEIMPVLAALCIALSELVDPDARGDSWDDFFEVINDDFVNYPPVTFRDVVEEWDRNFVCEG